METEKDAGAVTPARAAAPGLAPTPTSANPNTTSVDAEKGPATVSHTPSTASPSTNLDAEAEPPLSFTRLMIFIGMAFLWTGSQIQLYLFGGVPPYIYSSVGGAERWTWFIHAELLALCAVCPFVGSVSDIIGRRAVALLGPLLIMLGCIICSTADTMNVFIGGNVFIGAGAGFNELVALAAVSEMAPVRKRGLYVSVLIFTIIPFCPSVLWGQLIAHHSTWRYIGLLCALWSLIGFVILLIFYHPPPRAATATLSRSEILLHRIDWIGGFLSISGIVLFVMGLNWGGQYPWASTHALIPLFLGACLIVGFVLWECLGAKYPLIPGRLFHKARRTMILTLAITAISGANFISAILFWPTQAWNVYGHDPIDVGVRVLPLVFGIMFGACAILLLLTVLNGRIRILLALSAAIMTAGVGSLAISRPWNMSTVWGLLVLAGLGIGGILIPPAIITTIVSPDDLIGTAAALTLSVRVLGGAVGYAVYHNVFANKFKRTAVQYIGGTMLRRGITDRRVIAKVIELTSASMVKEIQRVPGLQNPETYRAVIEAGQLAFAEAYKWVYYATIPFGVAAIIAALFLGNIRKHMTDHIAVLIR